MDLDIDDQASTCKKFKQNEVVICDEMEVERDAENSDIMIGHDKTDACSKGKSIVNYFDSWPIDMKDPSSCDLEISSGLAVSADSKDHFKGSSSGSINTKLIGSSNSDLSYIDDNDFCDDSDNDDEYVDDISDDDNDDYLFEDDYLAIQSKFDNVDLPTGVEVSLPWLKDPSVAGSLSIPGPSVKKRSILDTTETESKAIISGLNENTSSVAASGSSAVTVESKSNGVVVDNEKNSIITKFKSFKQFDTVEDFSDHHYSRKDGSGEQPSMSWAKRVQEEWKILEKDLPDTISVRVYETRMELLRAVIVGPAGTPYHDGLFFFDCLFPPTYPNTPPMVYYYSGGLRLNPNLYECGKVCLSLLGTWSGNQNEMWIPGTSTMLQVLVSIQALILNARPFFNEPGYESSYVGQKGEEKSRRYNEDAFIMSLKTMVYTLRRPPKYFEDYVVGHFHTRAQDILIACKSYEKGAIVGSVTVRDGVADIAEDKMGSSAQFKATLTRMINSLITNFTRFGSINCDEFQTTA